MKTFYIIGVIIVILLVISTVLPRDFELKSEIVIQAPVQKVRDYVTVFANQKEYSVRVMADPDVKLTYSGTDGTVGSSQSWDSSMQNVGAGKQTIIALDPLKSMDVQIDFSRPIQSTNYAKTILQAIDNNQTKMTTIFYGSNSRPSNVMNYFFLPQVQKDMDANSQNLKQKLE